MTDEELLKALRAMLFAPPAGSSDQEIVAGARALFRVAGPKWLAEWTMDEKHHDGERQK